MASTPTPAPIFLRFAPHRRRRRILDLEPLPGSAGAVERAEPLRHDALAAELAGVFDHDIAVADEVLVECNSWRRLAQQELGGMSTASSFQDQVTGR
jgi:hypothetical protein